MSSASWLEAIQGGEHWRALLSHRGPHLAAGALALVLAAQAALLVTNLAGVGAPASGMGVALRPREQTLDVAAIVDSHFFGLAPASSIALGTHAPRTDLPLVLTGVIADRNPRAGMAILGPSAGAAKVYEVGDRIPGGARLRAVLPRKVLLERDGRLESLALPKQEALPGPTTSSVPGSSPAFVQRMRELVTRRPDLVADLMRPEPVFAGGRQLGYRVYPGNDPQAFTQLGFKPGDLVTAIDGTPLNDPTQDQQILNTLGSSAQASVTVLRNGRQRVLTLNLAEVEQTARQLSSSSPAAPPARPFWAPQSNNPSK